MREWLIAIVIIIIVTGSVIFKGDDHIKDQTSTLGKYPTKASYISTLNID